MIRPCEGCGNDYDFQRTNQTRCSKDCGRTQASRERTRKERIDKHELEFIAVDGEGVKNKRGGHDYVLLSVGDKSIHLDGMRLSHMEIFGFLWQNFLENPKAVYVGFFLGYDFTQWLRSLRVSRARSLLTKDGIKQRERKYGDNPVPFPVRVGDWEIDLLGDKRFKLRPFDKDPAMTVVNHKDGTTSMRYVPRPWMYICDAGPFFQEAFLKAIDPKSWTTPVVSQDEYDLIARGKEIRPDAQLDADMIRYNLLENEVMARLMTRLNEGFVAEGVKLKRQQWFGPGQAAQAWMTLIGTVSTREVIQETVPPWAREAARDSYYGGWFEIFFHGPIPGSAYGYDINSAYPTIIAKLPCLLHGVWTRGTRADIPKRKGKYRLIYATVHGKSRHVGAMLHRTNAGTILRPQHTKGWYWEHELQAAKRAGCVKVIEIEQWMDYAPCDCEPPLASITGLYEGRLQVGKKSPHGKALKLVYNSTYGKLAQSIGSPKYTNSIYASLITAGCRTMILDAIATHPTKMKSLLMVATDSVTFKEPHPKLPMSETALGQWSETVHENLSLFMPGLYWDDESRVGSLQLKSRGMPGRDLHKWITRIDRMWERDRKFPVVEIPIKFAMISARLAIHRNDWRSAGTTMENEPRVLNADPSSKRNCQPYGPVWNEEYDALESVTYEFGDQLESVPYDKAFVDDFKEHQMLEEIMTPDGPLLTLINSVIH